MSKRARSMGSGFFHYSFFFLLSLLLNSDSSFGQIPIVNPTTPTTTPIVNPGGSQFPPPTPTVNQPSPPPPITMTTPQTGPSTGAWCIASPTASETALQVALDYACGYGGADCTAIQPGATCYNPNTLRDHASYAFNDYYQKNPAPTSCAFGGIAQLIHTDPSSGSCRFSTPRTTPAPMTPTPTTPTPTMPTPTTPTPTMPTPTTPSISSPINPFPTTPSTPTGFDEPGGYASEPADSNQSSVGSTACNLLLLLMATCFAMSHVNRGK